ncbi:MULTISPECIES: UxaA family hydrolase [Actinoalloteichus]|uniref:Altronate dehydratase n=1 Tax=Actinoalloteichus fjordicus TaxID=1612552 RepID=A0AAC9LEN5_9PSEU|nr:MULTISPECIES: altronate dehydratase family protein [Actinoalloteichus]APU16453.1 altronate dehydratase [Actinoalloteichus fjordicus]APU22512.1 altronate dehydratase [Actinoalloteichus sp. GBA129-24]
MTTGTPRLLRLRPDDAVAVSLDPLAEGTPVTETVAARAPVPAGHKVALTAVATGGAVTKYGQVIGYATEDIVPGDHVHLHNLAFADTTEAPTALGTGIAPAAQEPETFQGIVRADGRVATRNYLGIITSVNCSATVAKLIADQVRSSGMLAAHPSVDGIVAITHGSGCGLASDGEGLALLRRTLSGYADHPNFGGLVVLGLGCEVNQVSELDLPAHTPVVGMTIQEAGGTAAAVRAGVRAVAELVERLDVERTPVPASELVLGLKCGGSDGYSGITANPALGIAADLLIAQGGTAILCETPEIYGAEHLLAARADDPAVAEALLARIAWWRDYTARHGGSLDNNPSPGNKDGGITTILEKSLGAVAKSGTTPLRAVRQFAEPTGTRGLIFMDTPGYDPVSVTGMVAGGANVVCFTTGRGSVYGCKPVPSLKLATNTPVYERMTEDMDLNCGSVADGAVTLADMGRRIFELILATASGRSTASEQFGFGDEEFAPWQLGAVM